MDHDFFNNLDFDHEAISKNIDAAMKGVNAIGNKELSKECLDLVNEAREGNLKFDDVKGIADKLLKNYAGRNQDI